MQATSFFSFFIMFFSNRIYLPRCFIALPKPRRLRLRSRAVALLKGHVALLKVQVAIIKSATLSPPSPTTAPPGRSKHIHGCPSAPRAQNTLKTTFYTPPAPMLSTSLFSFSITTSIICRFYVITNMTVYLVQRRPSSDTHSSDHGLNRIQYTFARNKPRTLSSPASARVTI